MMQKLQPPSIQRHQQKKSHVHNDLRTCLYVFMRNDTVKKPLQPPYDGPFQVLHRNDKHFTLDITGKKKVVSLDRLKPAYMDTPYPLSTTAVPIRTVHLPMPPQLPRISLQHLQLPPPPQHGNSLQGSQELDYMFIGPGS